MGKLVPKKSLLKKKTLPLIQTKGEPKRDLQEPFMVGKNLILNVGRLFFYGHSIHMLANLGGFQYCRTHPDLSLSLKYFNGKTVKIPTVVLCTRNRMYAFKYLEAISVERNTNNLEFIMDQFDIELAKLLKGKE